MACLRVFGCVAGETVVQHFPIAVLRKLFPIYTLRLVKTFKKSAIHVGDALKQRQHFVLRYGEQFSVTIEIAGLLFPT